MYHTIIYYTILYYTILYYTALYYTILYYTILYCCEADFGFVSDLMYQRAKASGEDLDALEVLTVNSSSSSSSTVIMYA